MKTKTNNIESIKLIQKKDLKGNFELIKEFKEILTNKDNISELIENNLYIDNIMQFIKGIEIIYSSQCIYSDGRVSAYDKNYWFWTLKNNIILDANAFKLDKKYLCNANFIRYDQSRIKDYSNSIFYYVNINTSKTKIYKYKNYYDKVINLIKDNIKTNDKILLITQKKEFQTINKKLEEYEILEQENYEISITWFGNIVGKNDWRNYNKIYIIASPNIPMELHVLQNAFWSKKKIMSTQMDFSTTTIDKVFKFNNEDLERIRKGFIASEIYQALARINRKANLEAEYYVLHNDEEVFDTVVKNFINCKINKNIKLDVEMKNKENKITKKKDGDILYEYLLSLPKNIYSKKEIEEKLQINRISKHLKYYKILTLIGSKIIVNHHTIEIL